MGCKGLAEIAWDNFIDYDTPMIVHVKNTTVGIINRLIQLLIIAYIIGYAIIYKKGYQEHDQVQSAVTTKVKGITFENTTARKLTWDVADYVITPQETNAFFVTTSIVPTFLQSHSFCAEHPGVKKAKCQNNAYCEALKDTILPSGNGPLTGNCVESEFPGKPKTCEIFGWCPVEDDSDTNLIVFTSTLNFTVFIKNNIEFPKFGITRRNIGNWYTNDTELGNCRWIKDHPLHKYCPIFALGDIVTDVGGDSDSLSILKTGGIMKIIIDWTCDLDYSMNDCMPEYSFSRLDRGNFSSSVGYNFRYADHFYMNNSDNKPKFYRSLYKVYGLKFLIEVRGQAGKFSIIPLVLNIASGMALLGIASVLCDLVMLHVLKSRDLYKRKKYLQVTEQSDEKVKDESPNTEDEVMTNSRTVLVHESGLMVEDNNIT